jgi:hypothetical protein
MGKALGWRGESWSTDGSMFTLAFIGIDFTISYQGMRALGILILLCVATLGCRAQTVYSVGIYSMGQTSEHDWTIGTRDARFGFQQYSQLQDADGNNLYLLSDVSTKATKFVRYTTIHCGAFDATLRGPAWIYVGGLAALLATVIIFAKVILTSQRDRTRRLE